MSTVSRSVAAELVRTRHTAGARLWAIGLAICAVQTLGWFLVATRALSDWDQLLGWQTAYVTAMAAPLAVLSAALAVRRERAARGGGTDWRAPRVGITRLARCGVLAAQLFGFHLTAIGGMLVFGSLAGLGNPPVSRVLGLVGALSLTLLPVLALGLLVAERIGLFGAAGLAVAWQLAGTLQAESSGWWWQPWTWSVRPALPLLRIHANGIGAPAGDPVLAIPVLPPVLLALALTALLVLALARVPAPRPYAGRTSRKAGSDSATQPASGVLPGGVQHGRPRRLAAAFASIRGLRLLPLGATLVLLELAIRVIWSPSYLRGSFGLLFLPGWVCLVACLVTIVQAPALRGVLIRGSALRWCLPLGAVLVAGLAPLVLVSALLTGVTALRVAVVAACCGTALLLLDLWLASRFGPGAAIGVTAVGVVMSLIFGGSQLASGPVWVAGPWAWAYSADNPARMVTAVLLSVPIAVLAGIGWVGAVRRAAASG